MENFKMPVPVEWQNRRVLTTAQIAEYYGCDTNNIKKNFNANRNRFIEGKHYFRVEGSDLVTLKASDAQSGLQISPMTRVLHLWTAAGIFLHCKMLSTPKAWELFSQIGEALSSENHPVLDEVIFSNIAPPEQKPELACVYAMEFDNSLVKIGMSNNVEARQGSIRRKLNFEIRRTYHTDFMPRQKAHQIEKSCHQFFHDKLAYRQEYFSITFAEACKIINAFAKAFDTLASIEPEKILVLASKDNVKLIAGRN